MIFENVLSVIVLILPWVIFAAHIKFFRGKHKLASAMISIVFVYAACMLQVHFINTRLEKELYAFDLNGDRIFSGTEITPNQKAAMKAVVNDTGRALAPITTAIFSVFYTSISFLALWLWRKLR